MSRNGIAFFMCISFLLLGAAAIAGGFAILLPTNFHEGASVFIRGFAFLVLEAIGVLLLIIAGVIATEPG
jgi:hypothetical protein